MKAAIYLAWFAACFITTHNHTEKIGRILCNEMISSLRWGWQGPDSKALILRLKHGDRCLSVSPGWTLVPVTGLGLKSLVWNILPLRPRREAVREASLLQAPGQHPTFLKSAHPTLIQELPQDLFWERPWKLLANSVSSTAHPSDNPTLPCPAPTPLLTAALSTKQPVSVCSQTELDAHPSFSLVSGFW